MDDLRFENIYDIGTLTLDEVFADYGFPFLFTCKNENHLFIGMALYGFYDYDWLLSEITGEILKELKEKKIDIKEGFQKNNGISFLVKIGIKNSFIYDKIPSSEIENIYLPSPNIYLS